MLSVDLHTQADTDPDWFMNCNDILKAVVSARDQQWERRNSDSS
jgi:hypothetical protein